MKLELVNSQWQKDHVKRIIEKHHSYVPSARSVGRRIDWLIYHSDYKNILGIEIPVGMIGIGSSVYPPPKDILRYVGMSKNEYKDNFNCFYIKNIQNQMFKSYLDDVFNMLQENLILKCFICIYFRFPLFT